jgi:hypothetical protein
MIFFRLKLAPPGQWLERLVFAYELLPLMGGGAEQLAELIRHQNPRLLVLDTFTAARQGGQLEVPHPLGTPGL